MGLRLPDSQRCTSISVICRVTDQSWLCVHLGLSYIAFFRPSCKLSSCPRLQLAMFHPNLIPFSRRHLVRAELAMMMHEAWLTALANEHNPSGMQKVYTLSIKAILLLRYPQPAPHPSHPSDLASSQVRFDTASSCVHSKTSFSSEPGSPSTLLPLPPQNLLRRRHHLEIPLIIPTRLPIILHLHVVIQQHMREHCFQLVSSEKPTLIHVSNRSRKG